MLLTWSRLYLQLTLVLDYRPWQAVVMSAGVLPHALQREVCMFPYKSLRGQSKVRPVRGLHPPPGQYNYDRWLPTVFPASEHYSKITQVPTLIHWLYGFTVSSGKLGWLTRTDLEGHEPVLSILSRGCRASISTPYAKGNWLLSNELSMVGLPVSGSISLPLGFLIQLSLSVLYTIAI